MGTKMANRIVKTGKNKEVTPVETQVVQALAELETGDVKVLKGFTINGVKEVDAGKNKALVVVFPFRLFKQSKSAHGKIVAALEKKFSSHVVLVSQRSTMESALHIAKEKGFARRPRSRCLTAVHEAILEDVVGSNEIIGKRTRCKVDGSKVLKVLVNPAGATHDKFQTFSAVYKKLTNKDAVFVVPESA
eukprot:GDKJ01032608.1.p2 GENE.GDKJ01032608.1~~GDKJ01032608.1.p2  ORF type:complete len:190 (+),score=53.64 GDKJ01032608.1:1-570(+)